MSNMQAAAPRVMPVLKRRLQSLTYLAIVTGVAVVLAFAAVWQRSSTGAPDFKAQRMFPALQAKAEDVTSIQVQTKDAAFNVTRNAKGQWVVPDKANYPADFNAVRKTILGLSELDLIEPRSARADWHERLGLGLPKSAGSGKLVTLKDAKGEVLASIIAGATVEGSSAGGRTAIYVRRPDQNQTYVARGNFDPQTDKAQWLDKAFIDLARDRVKTAAVNPFKGRAYSVTRAKPTDDTFRVVEAIPAGRVLRTESEANGLGNALLGLSFDDVEPMSRFDFGNAARVAYVTFDGLTLSLSLIEKDRDFWMTIKPVGDAQPAQPAKVGSAPKLAPNVAKEAEEINHVVAGWAYKIPRYKATILTAPLDDLLKPVGGPRPASNNN